MHDEAAVAGVGCEEPLVADEVASRFGTRAASRPRKSSGSNRKLKGQVFRIGHLGAFNDLMLVGTLAGVEMGLSLSRASFQRGGGEAGYPDCPRQRWAENAS